MKHIPATALFCCLGAVATVKADPFVHEQSAATSSVTFNGHGFIINGKPTFIFGGQIESLRIPRDQWRDRLLKMKRAGYNTVATYVFWNAYEPNPGEFHFEDNLDLDAWLTLIESLGMYTFLRVGPYVCAEWDMGGFPSSFSGSNMPMRTSDPSSLSRVDAWWTRLFPIVVKHQIHKGGSIILVQLENEYNPVAPQDPGYLSHLETKAKALGMEVPYIFSGQNHDFAPNPPLFPNNTWMTTEFWSPQDFAHFFGPLDNAANARMERTTWKISASGTAGFSHYMVSGGTNFGYSGCGCIKGQSGLQITSYDMQAPIGETGQLRPIYFMIKRAGLLTQSFNPLLAGSSNGANLIEAPPGGIAAYVNTSPLGKLAFLENTGPVAASVNLKFKNKSAAIPMQGSVSLAPGQFCHFLADYVLTSNDTIDYLAAGILSAKNIGPITYLVCYGAANARGEISLHSASTPAIPPSAPWQWNASLKQAKLSFAYPANDSIAEYQTPLSNGKSLKLLAMNSTQADLTWITDSSIVSGPQYVTDSAAEFPVQGGKAVIYSGAGRNVITQAAVTAPPPIKLPNPTWSNAAGEADTNLNDSSWLASTQPKSMDAYGFGNGYGWYRTTYMADQTSSQTIALPTIANAGILFWNGKPSGANVQVKNGKNVLAILACQYGRDKLFSFSGPAGGQAKGVLGQVRLGGTTLTNWRFKGGLNGLAESGIMGIPTNWTAFLGRTWSSGGAPADNVPRFFKVDFNYAANPAMHQTFRLTSSAISRGVAWFNGHSLGRTINGMSAFAPLYVPESWLQASNTLVLFSEDGKAPQNLALSPMESYAVRAWPAGSSQTIPGRKTRDNAIASKTNTIGIVFDMQGKVVARASGSMPLSEILKSKCSPGIYLFRSSAKSEYFVVPQYAR